MACSKEQKEIIGLNAFAFRHFNDNPNYPQVTKMSVKKFILQVNMLVKTGKYPFEPGYAEFCKHIFVPNFANMVANVIPITEENKQFLKSGYYARRPEELPVLTQWFSEEDIPMQEAKLLDIILYSKEQINKETVAMGNDPNPEEADIPWEIVSIKPQNVNVELPMTPVTMMRNALDIKHGGSGVPLDRDEYIKSVAFWSKNAMIKSDAMSSL